MKIWNVAIYARVSTDKKEQEESMPAQVQSLKKWLSEKAKEDTTSFYNLVEIYEDKGFTGSNFDRKDFNRMIEDIEAKKINMVLTRDLSRFARNYIDAGYYIENYFIVNQIRFVCTLDNVDNFEEINDIIPFKNILNEYYIKDCSKKVRDALKQRMIRGSSIASRPPYGYKFEVIYEGDNKTIMLVPADDETTEVVREIFKLFLNGWGYGRIATYLNSKKIPPPSKKTVTYTNSKFGIWCNGTIKSILTNPKYGGIMMQQRWKKISYKVKTVKPTEVNEWINGGEFKGIIEKDIFEEVQGSIKKRSQKYRYKGDTKHTYSTVLKCNECHGSMSYRKNYNGYKCTNSQKGGGRCSAHSIKEEVLNKIIVRDLRRYVAQFTDEDKICKALTEQKQSKASSFNELEKIKKELKKLDRKFQKVYDDKLNELINQRNFENIVSDIQEKQDALILRKKELENLNEKLECINNTYEHYKDLIDKLINFQLFERELVEKLVSRIIVSEDKLTKVKNVDIYYNFKDSISEMTNNV